jgi:hypothetical protein
MSYTNLPKGSILYIEAKDLFAINPSDNKFDYKGLSTIAPGSTYNSTVATTNGLAWATRDSLAFRRVSEHNRSEFTNRTLRIEQSQRMANGLLRKYVVADKQQWDVSWNMLPSFRNETVDGAWGAEDLKAFYESSDGSKSFRIKINPTVFSPSNIETGSLSDDYTYTVVFTSCDFSVVKRGLQTFWNVKLSLEQV